MADIDESILAGVLIFVALFIMATMADINLYGQTKTIWL
jgi:hypothetical protein